MKPVLHVITTIERGGAENQLSILAKEQIASGRKVEVVFLKGEPELAEEWMSLGLVVHSSLIHVHPIRQIILLRRLLKKNDVIVHAHLPRAELISRFSLDNQRFVVSRHNAEPFFPGALNLISTSLSKFVTKRASIVIAISNAVREFLLTSHEIADESKLLVIHYGFIPSKVSSANSRTRHRHNASKFTIGTIARLVPQKDLLTLLRSTALLKKQFPNIRLLVLGDGPLKEKLKLQSAELGIHENVEWVGRTINVAPFLAKIDTFVLTSLYEGFGMVLLEAMDARVPIVAANNSAIPEVLGSDFPGLAATGNVDDFAEKILLSTSKEFRTDLLHAQASRIRLFSAESMRGKIDQVYQS